LLDPRVDLDPVLHDRGQDPARELGSGRIALGFGEVALEDGGCGALAEVGLEDGSEGQSTARASGSDRVRGAGRCGSRPSARPLSSRRHRPGR
jgi:hypothetical protein